MNDRLDLLIARYLCGEATSKERNELQRWIKANDSNLDKFNKLALSYQLVKGENLGKKKQVVFSGILNKINASQDFNNGSGQRQNRLIKLSLSIAASILIILTVSALYFLNEENISGLESNLNSKILKSNPAGQKSKVFLPDGSIVWLNSESSLTYDKEFNDSIRFVELNGEAYFEVKRDTLHPFIVKSKSILTTALGTSFNINCFGNTNEVTVALTSGKIMVQKDGSPHKNNSLIINPGEGVIYNPKENEELSMITVNIEEVKNWKDGILEFKKASMNQTIIMLSRWYGVEIILNNKPLRNWEISGIYDNEYLENILETLSFSQGFEYEFKGKQVYITFKQND